MGIAHRITPFYNLLSSTYLTYEQECLFCPYTHSARTRHGIFFPPASGFHRRLENKEQVLPTPTVLLDMAINKSRPERKFLMTRCPDCNQEQKGFGVDRKSRITIQQVEFNGQVFIHLPKEFTANHCLFCCNTSLPCMELLTI